MSEIIQTPFVSTSTKNYRFVVARECPKGSRNFTPRSDAPVFSNGVENLTITYTISGAWLFESKGYENFTSSEGHITAMWRSPNAYRITAVEDNSGMICVTPVDGRIRNRGVIKLTAGESIKVSPEEDSEFVVIKGYCTMDGVNCITYSDTKFDKEVEIVAGSGGLVALHLWRY